MRYCLVWRGDNKDVPTIVCFLAGMELDAEPCQEYMEALMLLCDRQAGIEP